MKNSSFEDKIKQIKELVKQLERKTIEFITASAELEHRYKSTDPLMQAGSSTDDLQKLEDKLSKILKNSI